MDTILITLAASAGACAAAVRLILRRRRDGTPIVPVFAFLTMVLPFAAGGFYTFLCAPVCVLLLADLAVCAKRGGLRLFLNPAFAAVAAVTLGYCLTPLWAQDRGMAVFGIARILPVFLLTLCMMQHSAQELAAALDPLPLCGSVMTAAGFLLQLHPDLAHCVTIYGRLAGFFQYPSAFAVFLLAGLILQGTKPHRTRADPIMDGILILGIIASGSRVSFVLLIVTVLLLTLVRRDPRLVIPLLLSLGGAIALSFLLEQSASLSSAARFTTIRTNPYTLWTRLLYFKDAVALIGKHPFGLGYWGYRAIEPVVQTGRYSLSYVHNELLQLLLDVGWIPALLMAWCFLRTIFSKRTTSRSRLLLLVVLAHCMMDFDLQYFVIWVILLAQLDFQEGRCFTLAKPAGPVFAGLSAAVLVCGWLSCSDLLLRLGQTDACLQLTPFHTEALTEKLTGLSDPDALDETADRILALNPNCSAAYTAKANSAFSRGDIAAMSDHKEQAIALYRYSVSEYCDYIDKLYYAYQIYRNAGDSVSAEFCRQKILSVPDMLQAVEAGSDPLTAAASSMALPEEYQAVIQALAGGS